MQQIVNFIIRYKNALLYVGLLAIALGFTIQSHSYHHSKFFNSSSWISGSLYQISTDISSYFTLRTENKILLDENKRLRYILFNTNRSDSTAIDTAQVNYAIISGSVIKNNFNSPRNYITINKGAKHGIRQDMGVITSQGILGIVEDTSSKFAMVQSILNTKSNINAKIQNTNFFGSLIWDGKSYTTVQLIDIPRLVPLKVGDTIVTGAMSSIFPENIPIGTIKAFDLNTSQSFYQIDVTLFNNMADIKSIYVISNKDKAEILELQSRITDE